MKHKAIALAAMLTAAMLTGCGSKDSSSSATSNSPAAQNSAASSAADSSSAAAADSKTAKSTIILDGSKCGVIQKAADQDAFTLKGLILVSDSGHHDYPSINEQISKGYQTEGLYSEFYLNEWIGVYADCNQPVSLYVIQNHPEKDRDYTTMTEKDLITISGESEYPNIATNLTPDKEANGHLTNFYVHQELSEGLYDMCFVSGEKICYVVQLKLTKQPEE